MATSIDVNKQSVKQLLESGKKRKFVIPEYQRPYAWSAEQIETLFEDLAEYTELDKESTYFLGTIVSYTNDNGEQEIIDGQQRITSLFLLLRAFYAKLVSMVETPEAKNFKSQIESALWEQDELTAAVDYQKILITSRVMGDEGNDSFANILTTGKAKSEAKDNYSRNYNLFIEMVEKYATVQPEMFYYFIRNLLNKAILLPITADSQDTALTIFSTLNDRGLALSDADIFKAKMYNHLSHNEKHDFIDKWKKLDEDALNVNESMQKLFYYYMFYLRSLENDRKTTTPGLRRYYANNNFERLYQPEVMDDLNKLVNLWMAVNNRMEIENEKWSKNIDIKQVLDGLVSYPNEFWKYPVVIYYLRYHDDYDFEENFLTFLRKLLAVLAARYIITPTINAVKRGILNLDAEIIKSSSPKFDFNYVEENELKEKIKSAHRNTVRMILKMLAYQHQEELLPEKWEIEHILPQKWQSAYFVKYSDQEVKDLVEHIGNKIPFEKKLNIIASNGYFAKKQLSYKQSKVKILQDLSESHTDWGLDEIRERDIRISDELFSLLLSWGVNAVASSIDNKCQIVISEPRLNDYHTFLNMFELEDIDESRKKFLDL